MTAETETPPASNRKLLSLAEHYTATAWANASHIDDPYGNPLATLLAATHEVVCAIVGDTKHDAHGARDTLHSLARLDQASAKMRAHFEAERDARPETQAVDNRAGA